MADGIGVWRRSAYQPGGGPGRVFLVLFSEQDSPAVPPISRTRHGVPTAGPMKHLEVAVVGADEAPGWIRGWTEGALRNLADRALGDDALRLPGARSCVRIDGEVPDPADLAHLQLAWGLAKACLENGCFAALDAHQARWLTGKEVLGWAPERAFDIGREVSVVFETDASPGYGHVVHTRGLAKFGRPDLLMRGAKPEEADLAGRRLDALALRLAMGELLRPGQAIETLGGPAVLEEYRPGRNAPEVHLNNEGLLLLMK
jgi:hypothetical protein